MFEDFSFTSPSSRPARLALDSEDRLMVDSDSNLISPLSSRCPSPQSHRFRNIPRSHSHFHRTQQQQQPPTSVPFTYSDPKRLSIATLTQKLHEHTLAPPSDSRPNPASTSTSTSDNTHTHTPRSHYQPYTLTPPETDTSDDGVGDCDCLSSPTSSTTSPTLTPNLHSDLPDFGLGLPFSPTYAHDIRAQRQQISRLQCNQSEVEAMQRSLREEQPLLREDDCHPSSLPPRSSPRRRALALARSRFAPEGAGADRGRRKSSVGGVLSSRVEKNGYVGAKRNEQGLRRKSVVSAALASMVEKGDE